MPIRIGTAERNGTFFSQAVALKTVLDRNPALAAAAILETPQASMQNAKRLHAGELEFGFMAANWIGRAKVGEPPFTEAIDLRMAAPMNAGPLFFITRADSGLRSTADLRGKRIAFGLRTSGMAQHAVVILGALGMAVTDVEPHYLDFVAGGQALSAGDIDAQLQCPIPNKVMTELSERIDVRVLPYSNGQLDTLLAAVPTYRRTMMHAGALRGLDADVAQPAVVNVLATHARVDDVSVHDAVAAIIAHAGELERLNALFAGLDDLLRDLASGGRAQLEFGGVPLHAGALRAYREAGVLG
ncbi:MAG: TAXI family TRAP transporter solute-binding subunit [Rhizobiales bacterium]|nr:TAXI family TRAP transporter solute-binding subunit [Hyphomicrobiales bacterium]